MYKLFLLISRFIFSLLYKNIFHHFTSVFFSFFFERFRRATLSSCFRNSADRQIIPSRQFGLFVIPLECGDRSLPSRVSLYVFTGTFHALHTFPSYDTQRHASQTSNFTRAYFLLFSRIFRTYTRTRRRTRTDTYGYIRT